MMRMMAINGIHNISSYLDLLYFVVSYLYNFSYYIYVLGYFTKSTHLYTSLNSCINRFPYRIVLDIKFQFRSQMVKI